MWRYSIHRGTPYLNGPLKDTLTPRRSLVIAVVLMVLTFVGGVMANPYLISATVPNNAIQLKDRGIRETDTVGFVLFRPNERVPEWNLIWNGAWKIIKWDASGITYQSILVHNTMTSCMMNILQYGMTGATQSHNQYNSTGASSTKAGGGISYIAFSTNSTAIGANDEKYCYMTVEVTVSGMTRQAAALTTNSTVPTGFVVAWQYSLQFTAGATASNLYRAGLAWDGTATCPATTGTTISAGNGCFVAVTAIPNAPINMNSGDKLTPTWTIQWTGS